PPSKPFLQSKKIVQECPECLVGILGENLYYHVFCNTSGGTSQSIKIGDVEEEMIRQSNSEDIYINSRIIRKHDHMKTDIYTLEFSCSLDNYNDFCWISWTKDGLPYANGDGTDRIHKSSVIVFANVNRPSVHLSVKDELILNARETTKVTCTAKSLPLSDIVWSVKGDTQIHVCNKSNECEININPGNVNERRNYTCTAYFKFEKYGTSATSSFLAVWRGEGSSLTTHSEGISIEWLVIGLVGLLAVVIILTAIVLARKLFLEENTHEHPIVTAANVQENEIEELNEDPTYAQVDKTRRTRPETEECKAKGSGSELVYADLDIEHLEKARTLTSRQRETTPTVYDDVDFTRTKSGSNK
ncbi:hypothetical protein MAR_003487, partial [Mya arenaria]